jgi:hypothetical protein
MLLPLAKRLLISILVFVLLQVSLLKSVVALIGKLSPFAIIFAEIMRWDLAEWSERCSSIPKITGSHPSGGSELTFRSDLLLTARGGST